MTNTLDAKQLAKLRALLITIGRDRKKPYELRRAAESMISAIDCRADYPILPSHFAYIYRLFKWVSAGMPERPALAPAKIAAAFHLGHQ